MRKHTQVKFLPYSWNELVVLPKFLSEIRNEIIPNNSQLLLFPSFEFSLSFSPPHWLWVKWDVQFGAFAYFSFRKGIFYQVWWLRKIACVEMETNFRMSDWSSLRGPRSFLSLPGCSHPKFLLWGIPAPAVLLPPHLEGATELNRTSFWGVKSRKMVKDSKYFRAAWFL